MNKLRGYARCPLLVSVRRKKFMLASLTKINKYYNGNQILNNVTLNIAENDRIGLVGVNGCGKTTLLRILTGKEYPDRKTEQDGIVSFANKTTVGYLEQMSGLDRESTVMEEMKSVFAPLLKAFDRMKELEQLMADDAHNEEIAEEYSQLSAYFESNDGYNIDVKIKTILNGMGFGEDVFNRVISGFSGGEKTRLAIAKLLLENPNLLILDEPTNHLDFQTVMWLEDYLKDYKGALLVVSHDRYFLDKIATSICEIEYGTLTRYKGNYTTFTHLKADAVERQKKEYEQQQKEIAKMEEYVAKNLVRASTSKSAKSRVKALEKMELIDKPVAPPKNAKISFEYSVTPPKDLLSVRNIDISVGTGIQKKTLVETLSFEVKRGEKLAIIGENGIGKSTLLKILLSKLPHKGLVQWTSNVKISYFDQESANLNPDNTVIEEIHRHYPSMNDVEIRSLLGLVRLTGENVFKKIGVISGGERAKVCFALMMLEHGNVLVLDEPTNHLDLATKEVLEKALEEYTGTIIFVSHDRYLLNRISTRILEIRHNEAESFTGGFDGYIETIRQREAEQQRLNDLKKQEIAREQAKEKSVKAYRSKEQRQLEAQRRNKIRQLEKDMETMQEELQTLEEEITHEEVYSDFEKMNQKCTEIDRLKKAIDDAFDEWAMLSEE